ncbi:FlgB family protein [Litoreibacter roseus]|uniref:Flagellar biosynthesis protein FlgB n=1 Tax=Litoreibacter roseus TaxID=2601869 RepID=A0A6N6JE64_9RHOB|nr:FlgB family protein [Litoreibacter roseus]GFE64415.1 flagellar biosynthesis protein FlgB [Litoreibacter roseus]
MLKSLEIFKTASAMARHAAGRQAVVARNLANSDTPGYQAQDVKPFKEIVGSGGPHQMRATRVGHIGHDTNVAASQAFTDTTSQTSPSGNSVSIESEMLKSIEAERQHSRAITIYQTSLSILKTSVGRGR